MISSGNFETTRTVVLRKEIKNRTTGLFLKDFPYSWEQRELRKLEQY